jgi:hypothetical protein
MSLIGSKPDKKLAAASLRESFDGARAMFIGASAYVEGRADLKRAVTAARHDVRASLFRREQNSPAAASRILLLSEDHGGDLDRRRLRAPNNDAPWRMRFALERDRIFCDERSDASIRDDARSEPSRV